MIGGFLIDYISGKLSFFSSWPQGWLQGPTLPPNQDVWIVVAYSAGTLTLSVGCQSVTHSTTVLSPQSEFPWRIGIQNDCNPMVGTIYSMSIYTSQSFSCLPDCKVYENIESVTSPTTITLASQSSFDYSNWRIEAAINLPAGYDAQGIISNKDCPGHMTGGFLLEEYHGNLAFFSNWPQGWLFGPSLPTGKDVWTIATFSAGELILSVNEQSSAPFSTIVNPNPTYQWQIGIQDTCNRMHGIIKSMSIYTSKSASSQCLSAGQPPFCYT